jgi:hypothetical protein
MFIEKTPQNKAAAKTSDNSNSDSDKTTDRLDVNKPKIDAEAFIKVYGVITRS